MTADERAGGIMSGLDLDAIEARFSDATADEVIYEMYPALVAEVRALRAKVERVEAVVESAGDLDNGILVWDLRQALDGKRPEPARVSCEDCRSGINSTCPTCGCCNHHWITDGACQCPDRTCGCREAREDAEAVS